MTFVVCQGYRPPGDSSPPLRRVLGSAREGCCGKTRGRRWRGRWRGPTAWWCLCGVRDLSGYDADMSYDLDAAAEGARGWGGGWVPLEPVAPPIAPPYKTAIAKEREDGTATQIVRACRLVAARRVVPTPTFGIFARAVRLCGRLPRPRSRRRLGAEWRSRGTACRATRARRTGVCLRTLLFVLRMGSAACVD